MRCVFRTVFVALILILLAFLIVPFIIGYTIQKNINQALDTFNKQQSPYITLSLPQFHRHWFYSDAQIKLSTHFPPAISQLNNDYTFDAIIKHGPLFVISQNGTRQLFFNKGALVIYGDSDNFQGVAANIFDWRNKFYSFAHVPLLKLINVNGINLTLQNLQVSSQEKFNHNIVTTLSIDSIQASSVKNGLPFTLTINKLTTITKGEFQNFIWLGTHNTSVENIDVSLNSNGITNKIGVLQNLSFNISNTLSADASKFNAESMTNVQSLTIADKTIQPVTLSYSLNNVDMGAYMALLQAAKQLPTQANLTAQIAQSGIDIAKKGFTFKLNKLFVGLPKSLASSPILASGEITLAPNEQLKISPTLKNDVEALITADAQLSLPQSLLKQYMSLRYSKMLPGNKSSITPEQLAEQSYNDLINNAMFTVNPDGSVQTRLSFSAGKLLINGHAPAFNLPAPPVEKNEGALEN